MSKKRKRTGKDRERRISWSKGTADHHKALSIERMTDEQIELEAFTVLHQIETDKQNEFKSKFSNKNQEYIDQFFLKTASILFKSLSYKLHANAIEYINQIVSAATMKKIVSQHYMVKLGFFRLLIHHIDILTRKGENLDLEKAKRILSIYITHVKDELVEIFDSYNSTIADSTREVFLSVWQEAFEAGEVTQDANAIKEKFWTKEDYFRVILHELRAGKENLTRLLYFNPKPSREDFEKYSYILNIYHNQPTSVDSQTYIPIIFSLCQRFFAFLSTPMEFKYLFNLLTLAEKTMVLTMEKDDKPYYILKLFLDYAGDRYKSNLLKRHFTKNFLALITPYLNSQLIREKIEQSSSYEELKTLLLEDLAEGITLAQQSNETSQSSSDVSTLLAIPSTERTLQNTTAPTLL